MKQLSAQDLVFNDVDRAAFVGKPRTSGCCTQWTAAFGDELRGRLEKHAGKLA